MSKRIFLFAIFVVYLLTAYGGIRSPDSEVVYQVALSLANHGRFDVGPEYPWGFGTAPGLAGERYAVFGPAASVAAVPLVKLAVWLEPTRWYESLPVPPHPSHYVEGALADYLNDVPPRDHAPHARRMLVALLFNPIVTTITLSTFWSLAEMLTGSWGAAAATTALYGLGTLAWPYSGTFFSEPLATLFILLSFLILLRAEARCRDREAPDSGSGTADSQGSLSARGETSRAGEGQRSDFADRRALRPLLAAGASLGVATCAHLTAILFAPFFLLRLPYGARAPRSIRLSLHRIGAFAAGLALALLSLALYNYARFGDPFQTGRSVLPEAAASFRYGTLTSPWPGIWGLLMSPGKGLLLYCPAVLLGLLGWRTMHRQAPRLSWLLGGAVVFRLGFLACRTDWHGGFSLGPRYLVMLIPFLVLPAAFAFQAALQGGSWNRFAALFAAFFFCAAQQLSFAIGEIFSHLHAVKLEAAGRGINLLEKGAIYWLWDASPLFHLLDGKRGPYLLLAVPVSNAVLWVGGCLMLGGLTALFLRRLTTTA